MPACVDPAAEQARQRLALALNAALGPHLGYVPARWPQALYHAVERVCAAESLSLEQLLAKARTATGAPVLRELLAAATVQHTGFFRHPEQFVVIRERMRAHARGERRAMRVWSAGCATGEEPYSLALCAQEEGIDVEILATDISARALEIARRGRYPARLTGALPGGLAGSDWSVPRELKACVVFREASLADPATFDTQRGLDLVLCRNVLIYFEAAAGRELLASLARTLAQDGCLVIAPVEVIFKLPDGLIGEDGAPGFLRPTHTSKRQPAAPGPSHAQRPAVHPPTPRPPDPTGPSDGVTAAASLLGIGDVDGAEQTLRTHLDAHGRDARAWFILGEVLMRRNERTQATIAFNQAARFADETDDLVDPATLRAVARRRAAGR